MTDPEHPTARADDTKPRSSSAAGALAWTVTITLVVLIAGWQILARPASQPPPPPPTPPAPTQQLTPPGGMIGASARYAVFATELTSPSLRQREQLLSGVRQFVRAPEDELRYAIVLAEVIGPNEAAERLDRIETEDEHLQRDIETVRLILGSGPDAVAPEPAAALADRHGWFGALALTKGLDRDHPDRREIIGQANRVAIVIISFAAVVAAAFLAGIALFITAIVLFATGRLRGRFVRPRPGSTIGVEMMAVFLAGFILLQLLGLLLVTISPSLAPIADWSVWLLAAIPLWGLYRGVRWEHLSLYIGWRKGRGIFREIGAGIVGYLAGLPVLLLGVVGSIVVMQISALLTGNGEEGTGPAHPLPDMLTGVDTLTVVRIVLLATVWAPLVEETVFRGAMYSQLRARLSAVLSGLLTGLIFAAIHPQGLIGLPALTSIGLVFALLREWRGSIIAPMVAHAINNGAIVVLLLLLFAD